jgi:y4mF family transcriptional regulator
MDLADFVKEKRKLVNLTQPELAQKAGVGLRFVRELEQGKESLRIDKVNQILHLFGYTVGAILDLPVKLTTPRRFILTTSRRSILTTLPSLS